jgi:hypothetical protein
MDCEPLYYRAMPEPPTPAEADAGREPAEDARLDNLVDGAFAFAITPLIPQSIGSRLRVVLWGHVAAVGLLSMLMALALPADMGAVCGLPGFARFLPGLLGPITYFHRKRLAKRLPT